MAVEFEDEIVNCSHTYRDFRDGYRGAAVKDFVRIHSHDLKMILDQLGPAGWEALKPYIEKQVLPRRHPNFRGGLAKGAWQDA